MRPVIRMSILAFSALLLSLVVFASPAFAQSIPPLGAAASFAVLGGTAITATGPVVISGNVGVSPGSAVTGFPPGVVVNGQIFTGVGSLAGPAKVSARDAYNNLKGQACPSANNLTGKILGQTPGFLSLNPGVYCFDTSAQLNAILTLNDGGDPNAIFIFQIGTTLTTASSSVVQMSSGGRGTNVYWQVGTSATIGTSTTFRGHIIADTSVTLTTSASTDGRVYALDGAATIDSTSINAVPTGGIQFSASSYPVGEGDLQVDLTVTRSDGTGAASVLLATSDPAGAQNCNVVNGKGSSRCDYEIRIKTVRFANGETSKIVSVFIIDDSYMEGPETFDVSLSNPTGGTLGAQSTATVAIADNDGATGLNPIDTASFFVRLHYTDFLNRQPDPSGFAFWTNEITSCANQQCIDSKRINVSAAFYISIEFQNTGYLVERLYKSAYGDVNGTSTLGGSHTVVVPNVRLLEFLYDTQEIGNGVIIGQPGADLLLENNKQAVIADFVKRSRFTTAFPTSLTPTEFVNALFTNTGVTPSTIDRTAAINEFGSDTTTTDAAARARALRRVAENSTFAQQEFNRAFVLMQYLGYLRRNPNDLQDTDYTGYDFWLTKLNQFTQPGDDVLVRVQKAEMVKAFIISGEYRQRTGP
jgi:hypothetical protein